METTRERANQENHKELVNNLQDLLEKNYDAEKGFTKAMKDVKNQNLKRFLQQQAVQRGRFVNELSQEIKNLNEQPKDSGSFTGDLHRTWIDIKSSVAGNTDEAVLEECIRGEKASWKEYEEKLQNKNFPSNISSVLQNQATEIHNTLNRVKTLEDLADVE
ncbi:MAG TPA: PA2169 family four-helix-bundle protein [Aequorivita sp.]|nr:PA2169 family four-helix-bundle protein [Aequorivita sp.]